MGETYWLKDELLGVKADDAVASLSGMLDGWKQKAQSYLTPTAPSQPSSMPSFELPDFTSMLPQLAPWASEQPQGIQTPANPSKPIQTPTQSSSPWDLSAFTPWAEKPQPAAASTPNDVWTAGNGSSLPTRPSGAATGASGTSALPLGEIDNSSRASFVRTAYPHALRAASGDANLAEMLLATAISENGDVGKGGAIFANNLFGIKAQPGQPSQQSATWEAGPNGERVNTTASFAAFPSLTEGFGAFMTFLEQNPRYGDALARYRQSGDATQLFRDVNAAGYATDKSWADKVANIRANQVAPVTAGLASPAPTGPQPTTPPPAEQTPAAQAQAGRPLDVGGITEAYKGVPYTFGGPGGRGQGIGAETDCSGFVSAVWKQQYGLDLPAHTDAAYNSLRGQGAAEVSQQAARPGDVVFYMGAGTGGAITHHMGIYAGEGKVLDMSVGGGSGVKVRDVGHAGQFVILRDPRLGEPVPANQASVPPPIVQANVAEESGGRKPTARQVDEWSKSAEPAPADDTMYRAPLSNQPADVPDLNSSVASSVPPSTADAAGPPLLPGDGGVAPVPAGQRPYDPDEGPRESRPTNPLAATAGVEVGPTPGVTQPPLAPPPSPYAPQQAASMEPAPDRFATTEPTVTSNVVSTLGEAGRAGGAAAAEEYANPLTATMPAVPRAAAIYQAAQGAFGDVVGRKIAAALGLSDESPGTSEMDSNLRTWLSGQGVNPDRLWDMSPQAISGLVAQFVLDPTNLVGVGEAKPLARAGMEAAEAAAPVVRRGAAAVGEGLTAAGRGLAEEAAGRALDAVPIPGVVQGSGRFGEGGMRPVQDLAARFEATRNALNDAEQTVLAAERAGDPDAIRAADHAYAATRREYDAVTDELNAARQARQTHDARLEEAGYGRPLEEADTLETQIDAPEGPRPYASGPEMPPPRTVDDLQRGVSGRLNAVTPDVASGAAGAGLGAASGDEDMPADERLARIGTGLALGVAGRRAGNLPPNVQRAVQTAQKAAKPGLNPLQWLTKFAGEVGYSSMIGPATATVNLLGNAGELLWSQPKELARAVGRGAPGEYGQYVLGQAHGLMQTGVAVVDAIKAQGRYAAVPGHEPLSQLTNNPVGKALTTAIEAGGRVYSGVPDAIFGTIAKAGGEFRAAAQAATDAGLKGPQWKQHVADLLADAEQVKAGQLPSMTDTQGVIDAGLAHAKHQNFQDELGAIGKNVRDIATLAVLPDGKGGRQPLPVLGNLITPFFNTPWNMNTRMLERTPAGLAMNSQSSKFDKYYDALVGSALTAGIIGLASQGLITGKGPTDPTERKRLMDDGWKPYSSLIDGVYVPNRVAGVAGPILNMAGDAHDVLAYRKADRAIASPEFGLEVLQRIGAQIKQQPYLQSLADHLGLLDSSVPATTRAAQYAASTVDRMVPYGATLRTIGTSQDPLERAAERGKDVPLTTQIEQRAKVGVGLRGDVPASQDVLGRPEENPQQGWAALFPKTSKPKADPIVRALADADISIPEPRTEITMSGSKIPLTPAEQRRYNELRGEQVIRLVGPRVASGSLDKMRPATRTDLLQTLLDTANDVAATKVFQEMPAADRSRRLREGLKPAS